ncbi:hypothetical protein TNCV_527281 [Trichonephila clavipes]|nr:hypothetical protein TNCV_527281 [Trichonephila clavipes]
MRVYDPENLSTPVGVEPATSDLRREHATSKPPEPPLRGHAVGVFDGPDTHTCILQLQRNPFLTPEESNPVDRKNRGRDSLNLHGSGGQRILLSQNIGL